MRAAAYRERTSAEGASPRRRATALALAILIELLLILALLGLGTRGGRQVGGASHNAGITFFPEAAHEKLSRPQARAHSASKPAHPLPPTPVRPPPPIPLPKPPVDHSLPMMIVTKDVYAASDIAKLGVKGPSQSDETGAGAQMAEGDSEVIGTGPNGLPLYAAQWYRRPTDRELATYMPPNPPSSGWGLVACKTIAHYHVEDCVELGQSPAGSHLAGAVRQAAWQFLVRPPRVGGKELTGTWVRIRIDYSQEASRPASAADSR